MRIGSILLAVVIGTLVAVAARAEELPFQPGEKLSLKVRYLGMNVADLDLSVNALNLDGRNVWPVEMHGETRGLFAAMHEIDETLVSYFDPRSPASAGWDRMESVDGTSEQERVRITSDGAKVRRVKNGNVSNNSTAVPEGVHDILGALYRIRTLPMSVGAPVSVPIFTGKKSWTLEGKVIARETIDVGDRTWDTYVVRCRTHFDGKFASDRDLTVWLSADARRIPVKIEADFMIGTMRATIEKYRGGELARN